MRREIAVDLQSPQEDLSLAIREAFDALRRRLKTGSLAASLTDTAADQTVFLATVIVAPGLVQAAVADAEGPDVLRRAYRDWPLFGVLLENAEMSLAKTDRLIGARYLALGGREDLTEMVLAEYDRTRRLVLAVTGHDRLLANRHVLSRAVSLRDPYVDALSYLQLRALAAAEFALAVGRLVLLRGLLDCGFVGVLHGATA